LVAKSAGAVRVTASGAIAAGSGPKIWSMYILEVEVEVDTSKAR
jgi:hypothetical protein